MYSAVQISVLHVLYEHTFYLAKDFGRQRGCVCGAGVVNYGKLQVASTLQVSFSGLWAATRGMDKALRVGRCGIVTRHVRPVRLLPEAPLRGSSSRR